MWNDKPTSKQKIIVFFLALTIMGSFCYFFTGPVEDNSIKIRISTSKKILVNKSATKEEIIEEVERNKIPADQYEIIPMNKKIEEILK